MPSSTPPPVRRYRLMIWLDQAGNPTSLAVATYEDEDKRRETCWTPEPFDSPADCLEAMRSTLDFQRTLW